MLYFVTLPNHVVIEVELCTSSKGQECLDKICQQLGIVETDYFGLQYQGRKGEHLWLNTRNNLSKQLAALSPPFRLRLRVKFFVQPHFLLQDITKSLFYQQVKQEFLDEHLLTNSSELVSPELMSQVGALIAQVELGDAEPNSVLQQLTYATFLPLSYRSDSSLIAAIATQHASLEGLTTDSAQYHFLKTTSALDSYGVEFHQVKNSRGDLFDMGIGPKGISLHQNDHLIQSIAYPIVQKATHAGKYVFLHTHREDGGVIVLGFKLVSERAANGLYRCVTEMHSFFRCDTVRNSVASQYSRDLKGTLASLFNENTSLGKKYVFDIQRTCREAYDHARRMLYDPSKTNTANYCDSRQRHDSGGSTCSTSSEFENPEEEIKVLRSKLEHVEEAFLCQLCLSSPVNMAFCPCGHVVACSDCSPRLSHCPLCRTDITSTVKLFLPKLEELSMS